MSIEFETKTPITVIAEVRGLRKAPACRDPDDPRFGDHGDSPEVTIIRLEYDKNAMEQEAISEAIRQEQ